MHVIGWWNDFGVPMALNKFLILMHNSSAANGGGGALPKELADYGLTLLARGSDPMWLAPNVKRGGAYTGTNLVWSLQIDVQRGALAGNATLVSHAFSRMWSSLVVSPQKGDGLMADGSFHQHGALLQSGSYGSALMIDILGFALLAEDTAFQLPPAPLAVFVRYLTVGQSVMARSGAGVSAGATFMVRGLPPCRRVGGKYIVTPRGIWCARVGAPSRSRDHAERRWSISRSPGVSGH